MIDIDIAVVTYNSEKWIDGFLQAIKASENFELSRLHLYFKDNNSSDNTVEKLTTHPLSSDFGTYSVLVGEDNRGFGAGSNRAAREGKSRYVLFLNIDTQITPDTFEILEKAVENSADDVAVWEMRQLPYEHPKIYNPVTMETSWCSGACLMLRRDVFELTGGFDESIFMYGEDVDLSWRIRSLGYKLLYVPESCVYHFSYSKKNEIKSTQYFGSLEANVMLRLRYGNIREIITGYMYLLIRFLLPADFEASRKKIKNIFIKSLKSGRKFKNKYDKLNKSVAKFSGFEYEYARDGAFYENKRYSKENTPLVSVIVRTCQRPYILYECLKSIQNQTYKNIEVCIAEDGENSSEQFIKQNFPGLNIKYKATGVKKGRSYAGNLALSMATGEYFNFLDDDDVFYSDHIETMVNAALDSPDKMLFYAKAFETPIIVKSKNPYFYKLTDFVSVQRPHYSKNALSMCNLFPIQTVFFKKSVYEQLGGFDTSYEYLEDWELWLKFSTLYDYIQVDKLTSEYRVPAKVKSAQSRTELLKMNEEEIRSKYMHVNNRVNLDNSLFTANTAFIYSIDNVNIFSNNTVYISGWGFTEPCTAENEKIYICITDNKSNKYFFETESGLRPDVAEAYPDTVNTGCGISSIVSFDTDKAKKISRIELICLKNNRYYTNQTYIYKFRKAIIIQKLRALSKYTVFKFLFSVTKHILRKLNLYK